MISATSHSLSWSQVSRFGHSCYPRCYPNCQRPRSTAQFTVAPPQHRLYFLPEPQGHGSFRPTSKIHRVSRLSHFSTCVGRHSSSASNRSAGDSRASTNARLFLRLRRRRQQSVEAQIHRDGAVVIGPIVGQGDERKSARAFAATEQLDLVCEL